MKDVRAVKSKISRSCVRDVEMLADCPGDGFRLDLSGHAVKLIMAFTVVEKLVADLVRQDCKKIRPVESLWFRRG